MASAKTDSNSDDLKNTFSCFPTGVAIATTMTKTNTPLGMTISSFNTVSINPPLILWSISLNAFSVNDFRDARYFAVNILNGTQKHLSEHFSSAHIDRFADIDWHISEMGLPIIDSASAILECETWQIYKGGDHDIIIGKVIAHSHEDSAPLIFSKGRFFSMDRLSPDH